MLRTALPLLAVLLMALTATADDKKEDKIDGKKLVGRWEPKGAERKTGLREVEYLEGGKRLTTVVVRGKEAKVEDRYRVDGNKLVVVFKTGDQDYEAPFAVVTLTDTELVIRNDEGAKFSYVRLEDKK